MRVARVTAFLRAHPRQRAAIELGLLLVFLGLFAWGIRGSFHSAWGDLKDANPAFFVLACVAVAAYYLVFVAGWTLILADWGVRISYATSLRAEMVSMLAKYVPGGVWTPAARVVAMRRAGVTDAALVTSAMLVEAALSAISGVLVFAISLIWVRGVNGPVIPLAVFALVLAVLIHPRVFRPLAARFLRRLGKSDLPPLRTSTFVILLLFYSGTWAIGGLGVWLLLRSVGAHPAASTVVFLGGVSAVGAIVAVLAFFAPSGLGAREGSMYGLMLAVVAPGAALSATLLNRVAITLVEVLLLLVGGLLLRRTEPRRDSHGLSQVSAAAEPAPDR
jgi:glycosyltransferase 2 family protein